VYERNCIFHFLGGEKMEKVPISIVIADDHIILREGLKKIFAERPWYEVVGETGDGFELIRIIRKVTPDLIILDISMPGIRGVEVISEIKGVCLHSKILMLTFHQEKEYLYESLMSGADGYLLKSDSVDEMFRAIETVIRNKVFISRFFLEESQEDLIQIIRGKKKELFTESLTLRQREVLKLIAEGKSRREIAEILFLSVHTVERHRRDIIRRLNLRNSVDLIKYALKNGYM
jgi:DNA-binding NarL/FixJ family response regulator